MIRRSVLLLLSCTLLLGSSAATYQQGVETQTAGTGVLAGTLLGADDLPVADATVIVWRGDDRRTTTTDVTGDFEISGLPVGIYQWTVEHNGRRPPQMTRDRSVIVWPDRIADQRLHFGSYFPAGEGSEADRAQLLMALEAAVTRWIAIGPIAYEFSVDVRCFCRPPQTSTRFLVESGPSDASRGSNSRDHNPRDVQQRRGTLRTRGRAHRHAT